MKAARIRIIGIVLVVAMLLVAHELLKGWAAGLDVWAVLLSPQRPEDVAARIATGLLLAVRFTLFALLPGFIVMQLLFAFLDARLAARKRADMRQKQEG